MVREVGVIVTPGLESFITIVSSSCDCVVQLHHTLLKVQDLFVRLDVSVLVFIVAIGSQAERACHVRI